MTRGLLVACYDLRSGPLSSSLSMFACILHTKATRKSVHDGKVERPTAF